MSLRMGKWLSCLILILALLGGGFWSGPALAEYTFIQEEITTTRGCTVLDPVLDVSNGYPVVLIPLSCSPGGGEPFVLYYSRSNSPEASSRFLPEQREGGPDAGWQALKVELDIINNINKLGGYTIGGSQGGGASGDFVISGFVSNTGSVAATYQEIYLDGNGGFTGGSSEITTTVPWPVDCGPTFIGVTKDGLHHAGWCGEGLVYCGPDDQAPTWVGRMDEMNWPHGGNPPTGMGLDANDNPYLVTLAAEDIHSYIAQPLGGWEAAQDKLPPNIVAGQTAWVLVDGAIIPGATVITMDTVIRWEGPRQAANYWGEIPCSEKNFSNVVSQSVTLKSGTSITYLVFQCADTGLYFVRVFRDTPETDIFEAYSEYADLEVAAVFGGMALLGARIDSNADLHVLSRVNEEDSNGSPIQTEIWTKIIITDWEDLPWNNTADLKKK